MTAETIAMVAGETSGDLLASHVLGALRASSAAPRVGGIGGPRMREQGFEAWWPSERLAVNGFAAVLPRLPELLWIRSSLRRRLLREPPRAFVGVDAPDFNLGLEAALHARGIPTVHFVSPSVWAWRRERIRRVDQAVDHLLCVFPFEPEIYAGTTVRASYIGHPLAEVIPESPDREAARAELGLAAGDAVVAVLPGSRGGEVAQNAPSFFAAAALLQRGSGVRIVVPVAHEGLRSALQRVAAEQGCDDVLWLDGGSHRAMTACDLVLVASGTATLECALHKRPMVIGYRLPELSWRLMKDQGYLPWVGLPNILAREFLVPELLQHDCTGEALAREAAALLGDAARCARLRERFAQIHAELRRPTAQLAAQAILETAGLA